MFSIYAVVCAVGAKAIIVWQLYEACSADGKRNTHYTASTVDQQVKKMLLLMIIKIIIIIILIISFWVQSGDGHRHSNVKRKLGGKWALVKSREHTRDTCSRRISEHFVSGVSK